MSLSYNDTMTLIQFVLRLPKEIARKGLHIELSKRRWTEAEFCAAVLIHGKGLDLTTDQWFDFHSKVPNRLLRDDTELMNKLSPKQRQLLI